MMILNKRIKREVKNNIFRYSALLAMLILSISIIVGMAAGSDSIISTVEQNNKNRHVESGEFSLFVPLSDKDKSILEKRGVELEDNFYMDFGLNDESTLRIFKNRKKINLISLDSGRIAKNENEIVIEKHYAKKHNYKINSNIIIGKKVYTITGIGSVPDYNMVIANPSDVSSDIKQFSVAFLSESGYEKLKDTGRAKTSEEYRYSYILAGKMTDNQLKHYLSKMDFDKTKITDKYMKQIIGGLNDGIKDLKKSQTEFVNKNINYHYENLTSFVADKDNARIHAYKNFARICKMTSIFAGVIFMVLIAYILSVFIAHNIEKESTIIGTLYSLGYVKKELILHFLILPVAVSALGGIIGTVVGFYLINPMSIQNVSYFSYPNIQKCFSPYLIIYGSILPPIIAAIVNFGVLNRKLSKEPLKLLRKEREQHKISNIKIRNFGFINSYRIRNQLREMRGNVILFLGIFISILLMVFGFSIYGSITHLISRTSNDVKYNYMYVLKYPTDKVPNGAQACYTEPFHMYYDLLHSDLEVDVQGIDEKNPYYNFKVKCGKNEVYISDSVAEKFGYKKGDKISLKDDLNDKYYTFVVADTVKYSNGLYLFMDINNMRSIFGKENNYYNTLLSSHKLNIDNGRVLSSITHKDIVKGVSLFMDNMFGIIAMMIAVSIVVAVLVMYLLIKMMIDKATFSISLIKIFGYTEKEIRKIYLNSSIYTVLFSIVVSLPISRVIVYKIYPYIVSDVAEGMPAYISPISCIIVVLIILLSYILVNVMLSYNLKKISLAEVLKDRE